MAVVFPVAFLRKSYKTGLRSVNSLKDQDQVGKVEGVPCFLVFMWVDN
jgi:hypothetical protein